MRADIKRVDVWVAGVKDQPGALAKKLAVLSKAGARLEFLLARRRPEKPGQGMVFVAPIRTGKQTAAAKKAGFKKTRSLFALRLAAADKTGLGAALTRKISEAGINIRGLSAVAVGKRAVFYFAFDSTADVNKAARNLKQI